MLPRTMRTKAAALTNSGFAICEKDIRNFVQSSFNGAVLPLIVSLVYLLFYKKDRNNTFYRMFSFFTGLVPISSLLAWVIIPFVYLNGTAPPSDDCTKFLMSFSQIANPLFVSAAALVIVVLGSILFIKKGVLRNYIYELQALKKEVTVNSDLSEQIK